MSINSDLKELQSRLRKTTLRSELVEATCLLMSSWINTPQLSLRNLREKIRLNDSVRKWPFRKLLSMLVQGKRLLLEEQHHQVEEVRLQEGNKRYE